MRAARPWPALCCDSAASQRLARGGGRNYAAEQGLAEAEALESGMQGKAKEFAEKGSELYAKA